MPVDIEELIGADHSARHIWNFVGRLNLDAFVEAVKAAEGQAGRNAIHPRLLISIWIYAITRGIHSARQIAREMSYEPGLRWLAGLRMINHHTLPDFRSRHERALRELFEQVIAVPHMNRLATLERVTQDGTKIRANVNKKTFSREAKVRAHLQLAREQMEYLERQAQQEQSTRDRNRDYDAREFGYDEARNEMICPTGKRPRHRSTKQPHPGTDLYVYAARGEDCGSCVSREACCPKTRIGKHGRSASIAVPAPAIEHFDRKMQTEEAKRIFRQRSRLAEFPNLWLKEKLKFRRFSGRGRVKAMAEALLNALTFNLQRLFRIQPAVAG